MNIAGVFSVDVEDWFHILDSPNAPRLDEWSGLPSCAERNVELLLKVLSQTGVSATFFWLAWMAEQYPRLLRKCRDAGHEIASHGYGHVLAYQVGEEAFREDITRAKNILESIIGEPVQGFRAPGFGITEKALWAFNVIREVGYEYDSSVFPAHRGHGGLANSLLGPHIIKTQHGALVEIPVSAVQILGRRLSFFGGGYLRLASKWLIRWGINRLHKAGNPLVVYVHPREIDSDHPRLPLDPLRRFKCYINIKSTIPKIRWLCENFRFVPMRDLFQEFLRRRNISFVKYD